MDKKISYILLTGPPGIGKTTLIKRICEDLVNKQIKCSGFFTEEVRDSFKQRIGFDVISLNGNKGILARSNTEDNVKRPKVGKYAVYIKSFEDIALPLMQSPKEHVLVLDEIGKMELLSNRFATALNNCLKGCHILGTIPYEMRQPIRIVETLKSDSKTILFVVTKTNRNQLIPEIVSAIIKMVNR